MAYEDGVDCYFYVYSTCTKGDTCSYRHSEEVRTAAGFTKSRPFQKNEFQKKACIFFQQGRCTKGSACPFYHEEATMDTALPGGCAAVTKGYQEDSGSRPPITTNRAARGGYSRPPITTNRAAAKAVAPPKDAAPALTEKQILFQQQLKQFKHLLDSELIAKEEYEQLKKSALAALVGGMTSKAAPKTQTQKIPSKNAPAQQKIVRTTTKQQRYSQLKARTVQVQKPALRKPQTTVLKLKPAGDRRTGISITRVVGGGRTIGNSALKKVTAKGDLKNRIRVQPVAATRAKTSPRKLVVRPRQPKQRDLAVLIKRKQQTDAPKVRKLVIGSKKKTLNVRKLVIGTSKKKTTDVRKLVIGTSKKRTPPKMVVTLNSSSRAGKQSQQQQDKVQQRKVQEQNRLKQMREKQLQQQRAKQLQQQREKQLQQRREKQLQQQQQQMARARERKQQEQQRRQRLQQQQKLQQQLRARKEREQQEKQKQVQARAQEQDQTKVSPRILNLSKLAGTTSPPKRKHQATNAVNTPASKTAKISIDTDVATPSPLLPPSPALTPSTKMLFDDVVSPGALETTIDLDELEGGDGDLDAEVLAYLNQ